MSKPEPADESTSRWENLIIRSTPPCADVTRLLSERHERRLGIGERIRIRLHFLVCVWCKRYAAQLTLLHRNLPANGGKLTEPSGQLSLEFRQALKAQLAREFATTTTPHRIRWQPWAAAVPVAATVLTLVSWWTFNLEAQGNVGAVSQILHAVASWPYFAGRALGIVTETPAGFPVCCFVGWNLVGFALLAAWMLTRRGEIVRFQAPS